MKKIKSIIKSFFSKLNFALEILGLIIFIICMLPFWSIQLIYLVATRNKRFFEELEMEELYMGFFKNR